MTVPTSSRRADAAPGQARNVAQFAAMALVWGASFLFMKVALDGVSYAQIAWSRELLGAVTLGVIVLVMRERLPRDPMIWVHFTVIAVTNAVIPHLLFAWAEQYVSSSLAAIYNAITPIATVLMVTIAFHVEKLRALQVGGVILGLAGVVVIIAPWQIEALTGSFAGQLACIVAASSYGFAIGYTRRFISHRPIEGITVAFMIIGISAAIMTLLTPVLAFGPVSLDLPIVVSLLLLGCLGTGVAYLWNINVLRAWGPTTTSTVTYLIPIVGVVLGVLVLDERLGWNEPAGAVLVLAGIVLTQRRARVATPSV